MKTAKSVSSNYRVLVIVAVIAGLFVGHLSWNGLPSAVNVALAQEPGKSVRTADRIGIVDREREEKEENPANSLIETLLSAADGTPGNDFGRAVAIDEDTLVVGAPRARAAADSSGAVYVFQRENTRWAAAAKLVAADGTEGDMFGYSVGVSGDKIVVGALLGDGAVADTGAVYIFQKVDNQWQQTTKLSAPDGNTLDWYGQSVAIEDNVLLVGAPGQDKHGTDAGLVYHYQLLDFENDGIAQVSVLETELQAGDHFGHQVALGQGKMVVGAFGDDTNAANAGAIYVFNQPANADEINAIQPTMKLTTADGEENDFFGYAVAVDNDIIVAGAYGDDENGSYSGSAYVFDLNARFSPGDADVKLLPSDGRAYAQFGRSVAIGADLIVVGAPYDSSMCVDCGAAYVFAQEDGNWTQIIALRAPDGNVEDAFGGAVAADVQTAVVGAVRVDDNSGNPEPGSAYAFQWVP